MDEAKTLVWLLIASGVVIALIIGLWLPPRLRKARVAAEEEVLKTRLSRMLICLTLYMTEHDRYPISTDVLRMTARRMAARVSEPDDWEEMSRSPFDATKIRYVVEELARSRRPTQGPEEVLIPVEADPIIFYSRHGSRVFVVRDNGESSSMSEEEFEKAKAESLRIFREAMEDKAPEEAQPDRSILILP